MLVFVRLLIVGRMIMGMGAVVAPVLMVVPVLVRPVIVGMRMGMIMLMAVCVAVLMLVRFAAVAVRVGVPSVRSQHTRAGVLFPGAGHPFSTRSGRCSGIRTGGA